MTRPASGQFLPSGIGGPFLFPEVTGNAHLVHAVDKGAGDLQVDILTPPTGRQHIFLMALTAVFCVGESSRTVGSVTNRAGSIRWTPSCDFLLFHHSFQMKAVIKQLFTAYKATMASTAWSRFIVRHRKMVTDRAGGGILQAFLMLGVRKLRYKAEAVRVDFKAAAIDIQSGGGANNRFILSIVSIRRVLYDEGDRQNENRQE